MPETGSSAGGVGPRLGVWEPRLRVKGPRFGDEVCLRSKWQVKAENTDKQILSFSPPPGPAGGLYPEGWPWTLPARWCPRGAALTPAGTARWWPLLPAMLWGALLWAGCLPDLAGGTRAFTLGVLGPWDCDPIFAQALPSAAAQLAVDRANQDPSLVPGMWLAAEVLPTGCDTPGALATFLTHQGTVAAFVGPTNPGYCPAAALLAQRWGTTLFSWTCGSAEGHGELVPTLPPAARVLLSVLRHFGWARVAIVSSRQDVWLATAQQLATALRTLGLPVALVTALGPGQEGAPEVLQQLCGMDGLKSKWAQGGGALLLGSPPEALWGVCSALGLAGLQPGPRPPTGCAHPAGPAMPQTAAPLRCGTGMAARLVLAWYSERNGVQQRPRTKA